MVFDGHSDIFTDVLRRRLKGETQVLERLHMPRLRKGGIEGACFVLWVDPPYTNNYRMRTEAWLIAVETELRECTEAVMVHTLQISKRRRRRASFTSSWASKALP